MTIVPTGAAPLLAFIRKTETGRDGDAAYKTIIGHNETQLSKPITEMTVDELLTEQPKWLRRFKVASGAAGAYQIIRKTLSGLKTELGLKGTEKFTPALQDRMAMALLRRRGFDDFIAGRLSETAFALSLAKEWASMPVLAETKGAKRQVKAGQSYYAGDGINKSLVTTAEIKAVLAQVLEAAGGTAAEPVALPGKGALDDEVVAQVQRRLKELGYTEVGNVDGDFGDLTETAILIFRHDAGLPLTPTIDNELIVALAKAEPREVPEGRQEATPADVREKVPEARDSWWSKILAFWGMIGAFVTAAVQFVMSSFSEAKSLVKPIADTFGILPWWGWLGLLGSGLFVIWLRSRAGEANAGEAYRQGARR